MKTPRLFLLAGVALLMSFSRLAPAALTDAERSYAINLLQETRDNLQKKVKGLTPEQLNFKASPESWSVAECVEHLAITESGIFGMCQGTVKAEANPAKRSEIKMSDKDVFDKIADRSWKVKTSEGNVPTNKFGSFDAALKEFAAKREASINYMKTTGDDMRSHVAAIPFGTMDSYQIILFMAGHTKRHTAQAEEVMANANFPKKK